MNPVLESCPLDTRMLLRYSAPIGICPLASDKELQRKIRKPNERLSFLLPLCHTNSKPCTDVNMLPQEGTVHKPPPVKDILFLAKDYLPFSLLSLQKKTLFLFRLY